MRYILLIMVLFLAGCTVTPEEFALANRACKDFGGLEYYNPYAAYARCNNGIVIENLHKIQIASE